MSITLKGLQQEHFSIFCQQVFLYPDGFFSNLIDCLSQENLGELFDLWNLLRPSCNSHSWCSLYSAVYKIYFPYATEPFNIFNIQQALLASRSTHLIFRRTMQMLYDLYRDLLLYVVLLTIRNSFPREKHNYCCTQYFSMINSIERQFCITNTYNVSMYNTFGNYRYLPTYNKNCKLYYTHFTYIHILS